MPERGKECQLCVSVSAENWNQGIEELRSKYRTEEEARKGFLEYFTRTPPPDLEPDSPPESDSPPEPTINCDLMTTTSNTTSPEYVCR